MAAFYQVRVAFKRWLARHRLIVEFCKDCGIEQPVIWTAPDALWIAVWGNEGGVLCPTCFDKRADARGYLLRWVPRVETVTMSTEPFVAEGRGIEPRRV